MSVFSLISYNLLMFNYLGLFCCCLRTPVYPGGTVVKNPPANAGDARDSGSISGLGRSPGEGNGYPLQYSCLESSMDCIVHGVAKSRSDFHFMKARTGNVRAVHCSPLETSLCDHCFSDLRIRWKNCEKNSFLLQIDCSSV